MSDNVLQNYHNIVKVDLKDGQKWADLYYILNIDDNIDAAVAKVKLEVHKGKVALHAGVDGYYDVVLKPKNKLEMWRPVMLQCDGYTSEPLDTEIINGNIHIKGFTLAKPFYAMKTYFSSMMAYCIL